MTIPLNVPSVINTTATVTTGAGFVNAIHNAISLGSEHWDVIKHTPGVGALFGAKDPANNHRIWVVPTTPGVPATSSTFVVGLDPDGKTYDPTGALFNFTNDLASSSPAAVRMYVFSSASDASWDADDMSGEIDVVETDDCISVFFYGLRSPAYASSHGAQRDFWYHGFQVGKIMTPDNPLEIPLGIDGSGLISGWPGVRADPVTGGTRYTWLSTSAYSTPTSYIRTGPTSWGTFVTPNCVPGPNAEAWDLVNGQLRLAPLTIQVSSGPVLGRSKYFRTINSFPQSATIYKVSDIVSDGDHQAWAIKQFIYDPATGTPSTFYFNNVAHLWTDQPIKYV